MGGSKTVIQEPNPPAAPSTASSMSDFVSNYPALFNLMQAYAPQEAALNVSLAQQYAQPAAEALKKAQDAMYPEETAINQKLNEQVKQGMDSNLPDWAKQSYLDTMRSQLGDNALSGSGADYMSRGLLEQQKNWQDYYRNLGLSITGRQPIYSASQPGYTNQLGNFTPNGVMNYNSSNYGNYANAYANMYGTNAKYAGSSPMSGILGSMGGAAAGAGTSALISGLSTAGGLLPAIL